MSDKNSEPIIVIGAGQYGLGVSYYLKKAGLPVRLLERGRVGESWRSQRWDSFMMNTANFRTKMPDMPAIRPEPEGFCSHHEFVAHLEEFAQRHDLAVETAVTVEALSEADTGLYRLDTSQGAVFSRNVVIATSCQNRPTIPALARDLPSNLLQMHAAEYRNPASLPPGAVLLVGSGSSGCQIAEDILEHGGRTVYLATSKIPRAPRRYRGRDYDFWSEASKSIYEKVEDFADQSIRFSPPRMGLASGTHGGHCLSLQSLTAQGAILLGRLRGLQNGDVLFDDDLLENLRYGDETSAAVKKRFDAFIASAGLDAPEDIPDWAETVVALTPNPPILSLDPAARGISCVIWCTGFDGDFSWIHLPVFDAKGWPEHAGGITELPGIYFIGLHWLYTRGSNTVMGVATDAKRLAGHISEQYSRCQENTSQ